MNRAALSQLLLFLSLLAPPLPASCASEPESRKTAAAAKPLVRFLQTAELIEIIQRTIDNQESLQIAVVPVMESTAKRIKEGQKDFGLHLILAAAYEKLGMEEMARSEANIAKSSGIVCYKFAREVFKRKVLSCDFELAMFYYPFVKEAFPKDSSLAIVDSFNLHKQGRLEEAEALLNSVSDKTEFGLASAIGSLKLEKRQYEKAIALFDKDLLQDPNYQPALVGKAKALEDLGRYGDSLRVVLPVYRENMTRNELAAIVARNSCRLGNYRAALFPALVSLAVARHQDQMLQAKRLVALIWPKLKKSERQIILQEVGKELSLSFFGTRLHFALADILQKSGFVEEAELEFRAGLKADPRHSSAYLHLGEIFQYNYHNAGGAILNYVKYLHFSGRDPYIEQRIARLLDEDKRYKDIALRVKRKLHPLKHRESGATMPEPANKKNEQAS